MVQDMLPIGKRIHRANVEKRCLKKWGNDQTCEDVPDLKHTLLNCPAIKRETSKVKKTLEQFLGRTVKENEIITLSVKDRNNKRDQIATWFKIRSMHEIYKQQAKYWI